MTDETAHMCRVCHTAPATTSTTFVVDHSGARVEHHACDRHAASLMAAMQDAGWRVEGSHLRLVKSSDDTALYAKSDAALTRIFLCHQRDGVDHVCGDPDRCEETDTRPPRDLGPLGHEFRTGMFGGSACVFGDFPRLCGRSEAHHA